MTEERSEPEQDFTHQAYRESLVILHRQTPTAVVGHVIAAALVVYGILPVVPFAEGLRWWLLVATISAVRFILSRRFITIWPIDDSLLPRWTRTLATLTFLQTAMWGLAAFIIWPEPVEYRAFLTAILLGVVAAGGVMLSIHRNSFYLYCLPVAIPVSFQLVVDGGRLERVLAALIVVYCVLLFIAVHRLATAYMSGLVIRLRMQALSRIDALTNLANRRGFDEYLSEMWQNSMRSKQPLGLMIADVDSFKNYNDHYGHPRGDQALIQTATLLARVASRGTDMCARVGGEEFAIILPSTEIEGTRKIAEEALKAFHEAAIPHAGSPKGILTVSMGFASTTPVPEDSISAFITRVDQALYKAKDLGKDQIAQAPEPAPGRPTGTPGEI